MLLRGRLNCACVLLRFARTLWNHQEGRGRGDYLRFSPSMSRPELVVLQSSPTSSLPQCIPSTEHDARTHERAQVYTYIRTYGTVKMVQGMAAGRCIFNKNKKTVPSETPGNHVETTLVQCRKHSSCIPSRHMLM